MPWVVGLSLCSALLLLLALALPVRFALASAVSSAVLVLLLALAPALAIRLFSILTFPAKVRGLATCTYCGPPLAAGAAVAHAAVAAGASWSRHSDKPDLAAT